MSLVTSSDFLVLVIINTDQHLPQRNNKLKEESICTTLLPGTPNTMLWSNQSMVVHICHILSNKLNSCLVRTNHFVTAH